MSCLQTAKLLLTKLSNEVGQHLTLNICRGLTPTVCSVSKCIMYFAYTLWEFKPLIRVKTKVWNCSHVLQLLPLLPLSSHFSLIAISNFVSGCE